MTGESRRPTGDGQMTSLTLLQRVRAQDGRAWERLHQLYSLFVLYWCGRWGVRDEDGDDVVQEVFRAAAVGLEGFRRDRPGDSFRAWLRGITHHMVLQHFRRAQRERGRAQGGSDAMLQMQQIADPASGPGAQEADPAEQISQLHRRAVELVRGEFEERTWQMFWRTVIDGRMPADVGAEMGVGAAAVRQAKARVLRRLKEEVGDLLD